MKMNAYTLWWLLFLALIKTFTCFQPSNPFILEDTNLDATEGSCVKIKCKETGITIDSNGLYWFWIKDQKWIEGKGFTGTIVYSTNQEQRPVSSNFANRVTSTWTDSSSPKPVCGILICNLNITDSGRYAFRYIGKNPSFKWITNPETTLSVTENPCLITFEPPPVVRENNRVTLTCSTSSKCRSKPKIDILTQLSSEQLAHETGKPTDDTISFTASWKNDGNVFTCQMPNNEDKYLIRNVSIVVEYAPKDTSANIRPGSIKEGDTVTLTCSAKGRPDPSFTWFHNDKKNFSGAIWTIRSIQASQNGSYHCQAENSLGKQNSSTVPIDVTYAPDVEVRISKEPTRHLADIKQGDSINFTCDVKRSNPKPQEFTWYKDQQVVAKLQTYVVSPIEPEHSGNYTCAANNSVGSRESKAHHLQVQYRPRNTRISILNAQNMRVKVNSSITFICNTDAHPAPCFSWYKQTDSSEWTYLMDQMRLTLKRVQRANETCYRCNATNSIGADNFSAPVCIQVLFPPTRVVLSMDTEVMEGQNVPITCSAESFPPSQFTIERVSSLSAQLSKWKSSLPADNQNIFHDTLTASSTDAGAYTCKASNSEGTSESHERKLVVKYTPKDVQVVAQPGLTVREGESFKLVCYARSHPELTSVTWMKMTSERNKPIDRWNISVKSASPSDSGLYSCTASNAIGAEKSKQVEVRVKYGPKHTAILKGEEQQVQSGETRSVTLSCITHCYPPAEQYFWYKKTYDEKGDVEVSKSQNFTVHSDKAGEYYCKAHNEISHEASDPIRLFDNRLMMAVKLFFLICLILLVSLLIFFLCRHRRNKSNQQGTTQPSRGFLVWRNGVRSGNLINETSLEEPFRSRDDLLPDQPCRPKAQRCQPFPDSTSASNINTVYTTVNLPSGKPAPSAPKPKHQHEGHMENDSINYASLHFGNKQKEPEEDVVYSKVSKAKPPDEMERVVEYENVSTVHAAKLPNLSDSDSDTSDDELEVNYTQVNFKPKQKHWSSSSDSSSDSTSSEDETQYSQVKV